MTYSSCVTDTKCSLFFGLIGMVLLNGCTTTVAPGPDSSYAPNLPPVPQPYYYNTPTVSSTSSQCYKVKPGDTLYSIAKRYGYNYKQLAEWNSLGQTRWDGAKPVYDIHPGQALRVTATPDVACY